MKDENILDRWNVGYDSIVCWFWLYPLIDVLNFTHNLLRIDISK